MKVLVACEFSGAVREAFRALGHEAMSCDLLPTEVPGPHYCGDVRDVLDHGWDLMVAHPPCTYLASSGIHWNSRTPGRSEKTDEAVAFVRELMDAPIQRIAIENPIGVLSSRIRKPDQIIQPWHFGHDASKSTCLWLKNLPKLKPTNILQSPAWIPCPGCDDFWCVIHEKHAYDCKCPSIDSWAARGLSPYLHGGRRANQTASGQNKLPPSPDRWKLRSLTYPGIAAAMAQQWGGPVEAAA